MILRRRRFRGHQGADYRRGAASARGAL